MTYFLKALAMAVIIWSVTFALGTMVDAKFYHPHFPFVIAFFLLSSAGLHAAIISSLSENPKRFPAYFMGVSGIKMLAYMIGIGVYVYIMKDAAVPVIVLFLLLYVLFTGFELVSLLPKVQQNGSSDPQKKA